MREIPAELAELAEDAGTHTPTWEGWNRLEDLRFSVGWGPIDDPHLTVVERLRMTPEQVAETVAEVRDLLRAAGLTTSTWEVGSSSAPPDLERRLLELGMELDETPEMRAMACVTPPESAVDGIEVRPAVTPGELDAVAAIHREADRWNPPRQWIEGGGVVTRYVAFIDGDPVATADITPARGGLFLGGAVTVPRARGRGAYRALVWARWQEAMRRGLLGLATQSEPTSEPILTRLGFQPVATIRVLVDRLG